MNFPSSGVWIVRRWIRGRLGLKADGSSEHKIVIRKARDEVATLISELLPHETESKKICPVNKVRRMGPKVSHKGAKTA